MEGPAILVAVAVVVVVAVLVAVAVAVDDDGVFVHDEIVVAVVAAVVELQRRQLEANSRIVVEEMQAEKSGNPHVLATRSSPQPCEGEQAFGVALQKQAAICEDEVEEENYMFYF